MITSQLSFFNNNKSKTYFLNKNTVCAIMKFDPSYNNSQDGHMNENSLHLVSVFLTFSGLENRESILVLFHLG